MIKREKHCPICNSVFELEYIKDIQDDFRYKKAYEQGKADAIEEYHLKLLNCQTDKVKSIHDAEIWVEFKRQSTRIAEQLKEQYEKQ